MNMPERPLSVLVMASVRWYNASAHYALFLARALADAGHRATVMGLPGSPVIRKAREAGLPVIESVNLATHSPREYARNVVLFRRTVREHAVDIIHAHFSRDHTFAAFARAGLNTPIVRTRSEAAPPKSHPLNRLQYRYTADFYTVPGEHMLPVIARMGVPRERIASIPLAIDAGAFAAYRPSRNLRRALGIPEKRTVVTHLGRLHEVKGVEYLVRAFAHLSRPDRFHLIVTGEEIDVRIDDLKLLARACGASNVSIFGREYDARDILSITDIGAIPSLGSEVICRVALEMYAYRIPVVGSDISSIPETIGTYGGIVVPPRDARALAAAIERLADPATYRRTVAGITARLKTETPGNFLARYLDVYYAILDRKKS